MRPNLIIQARVNQRYVHTSLRHWFTHSDLELRLPSDFSGAEALTRRRRARSARGPESQLCLAALFLMESGVTLGWSRAFYTRSLVLDISTLRCRLRRSSAVAVEHLVSGG